jgi:short-subunit dehydrogenase
MTTETTHVARSAAITGAGSGLGREIATGFANNGYLPMRLAGWVT